jgi:riboflavin biosynthesis pyrimidine reductase
VRLIHPERRSLSPEELVSNLRLQQLAPPDRPYLGLNMVSSLDGKATLNWRTKGLSSEIDRRVFHLLRMTKNDELRQRRVNEGFVPDALAVVVSGRLNLPPDLPLLNEPEQRVVIATAADHELPGLTGDVEYARVGDDLPRLLAYLHERHGVRSILCEGGPTLNSFLFAAGLVDELFLTLSPKLLAGASALTIVAGRELVEPADARLVSVAEAENELFTRWRFSGG